MLQYLSQIGGGTLQTCNWGTTFLAGPCHVNVSLNIITFMNLPIWSNECKICCSIIKKTSIFGVIIKVMTDIPRINVNMWWKRDEGGSCTTTDGRRNSFTNKISCCRISFSISCSKYVVYE